MQFFIVALTYLLSFDAASPSAQVRYFYKFCVLIFNVKLDETALLAGRDEITAEDVLRLCVELAEAGDQPAADGTKVVACAF
jgi:hypothetical protein